MSYIVHYVGSREKFEIGGKDGGKEREDSE